MRPITRRLLAAVPALLIAASAHAQIPTTGHQGALPDGRWEVLTSSGALVATGAQRDAVKDAPLSTIALFYRLRANVALTTSAGWARSRDLTTTDQRKLSVFSYDLGAEWRASVWPTSAGTHVMPFAGAGVGGRSYDHRGVASEATHGLASYAAVGAEIGVRRLRLRLEARDYVSAFRAAGTTGSATSRNDLMLLAGLRFTRRVSEASRTAAFPGHE